MKPAAEDRQRCDVWLFRARLFKSRSGAGAFIEGGGVRVERSGTVARLKKASHPVRPGDRLVYIRFGTLVRVTVLGLGERRGPAAEARTLYTLEDASTEAQ
ncbi:MAG: RNA-binding S4 domain-containing protein [Oceanicaulis sp.]